MTGEREKDLGIRPPHLDWDANAPRSLLFGDIYFSGEGPAESEHVFLGGNDLAARFSSARLFSIGELGFGTGLNFLKTWALWRDTSRRAEARLRFFSVEGFPLSTDDLARAHEAWPELAALSARLRAVYPPRVAGVHRLELDDDVTLTLFFGEAGDALSRAEGGIDAWFFDGFSPAKNPDMWRTEIFAEAARLSNPGATFATFTVAGHVRRALTEAGFSCEKRPGFGAKREMLAGRLMQSSSAVSHRAPWFRNANAERLAPGASVGIIGGGVAGASLAFAARRAGMRAAIIEPQGLASGASGNPAGLVMPRIDLGDSAGGRFFLSAYLYTVRLLIEIGENCFNPCGVLLGAPDEKEKMRQEKLLAESLLPPEWMESRGNGLFFPQGGAVHAPRYVQSLAGSAELIKAAATQITRESEALFVRCDDGATRAFDAVVIANGVDALKFLDARTLPLSPVAGQIDWFANAPAPREAFAFGPYAAPAAEGGVVIGATYEKIGAGERPRPRRGATQSNLAAIAQFAPDLAERLRAETSHPRASLRCQTPDRLPVAGPLPDLDFFGAAYDDLRLGRARDYPPGEVIPKTFILSGLGSRGLVTAPLAAAMILAEMTGEPTSVDHEIAQALHPARFFIRDLKRARTIHKN